MTQAVDGADAAENVEAHLMELRQEDFAVQVNRVMTAKVKVASVTSVENTAVEQPLVIESVEVTHLQIGEFVSEVPIVRLEGDTTIWPVFEERYVLEKRIFLVEEVHIRNVRKIETHSIPVAWRKQDVVIERTSVHPAQLASEINKENPMNDETIVAIYDTSDAANSAVSALHEKGIAPSNISLHVAGTTASAGTGQTVYKSEPGFWESLFGFATEDSATYDRSLNSGSTVVSVKCASAETTTVTEVLDRFHPVDIDERGKSYSDSATSGGSLTGRSPAGSAGAYNTLSTDTAGAGMGSTTGSGTGDKIELAEESLTVGKRAVNMGTARVRRYVVETPFSEDVRLRDETVTIERRPVTDGRKVTDADFTDKVIEMNETREEAVISKTARVVEEVAINKQATERTETVRDTIRRDEVEITKAAEKGGAAVGSTPTMPGSTRVTPGS